MRMTCALHLRERERFQTRTEPSSETSSLSRKTRLLIFLPDKYKNKSCPPSSPTYGSWTLKATRAATNRLEEQGTRGNNNTNKKLDREVSRNTNEWPTVGNDVKDSHGGGQSGNDRCTRSWPSPRTGGRPRPSLISVKSAIIGSMSCDAQCPLREFRLGVHRKQTRPLACG